MTDKYFLSSGTHSRAEDGRCAMEWVSYLAGEAHSDRPACVSPVLQGFCISLNDALSDDQRQRLRPYLARTIGTVGDGLDGKRRWMCADWLIREYAPTWLALVPSLVADAERLRALPPAPENVQRTMAALETARKNAAAAGAAARDAAGAAAWVAAWAAAWVAVRAAAGDAAGDAVGDAVGAALAPTARQLQDSILSPGGLLDRMLPTVALQLPVVGDAAELCGLAPAAVREEN